MVCVHIIHKWLWSLDAHLGPVRELFRSLLQGHLKPDSFNQRRQASQRRTLPRPQSAFEDLHRLSLNTS